MGVSLLSCEVDARVGGSYRFGFGQGGTETMAFFGKYLEVKPHSRLVWTNEEGGGEAAVTTLTFEENAGKTLLVLRERHPRRKLSTRPSASAKGCARPSGSWTRSWSPWAPLDGLLIFGLNVTSMGAATIAR